MSETEKKGRMGRVYTAPGKKAPTDKVKHGGKHKPEPKGKTPKMGG